MTAALRNLASAKESIAEGPAMEAFHLEGPYISPEDGPRGAHPARWVRPPDLNEFLRFQEAARGNIRLLTLSPEWPEAPRFIETIVEKGVVASIGHTRASASQIADAVSAGATLSTHLGNGADAVLPQTSQLYLGATRRGSPGRQLHRRRISSSAIVLKRRAASQGTGAVDLNHRCRHARRLAPRAYTSWAKWTSNCTTDGSVRLTGGSRLAGSALRMDQAIANVMRTAGLSLREAITLATRNPARVGRVPSRQRGLNPGERADLVRFRLDEASARSLSSKHSSPARGFSEPRA